MKKVLFVILCFMFLGIVNAKELSIEEIMEGFYDTTFIKATNENPSTTDEEKIRIVNNTENSSLDIYVGNNLKKSYSYSQGYIYFKDDREITEETALDQFDDFIFLEGLMESALKKSGVDINKLKPMSEDFEFDFDRDGIYIKSEKYNFSADSGTTSGDFIREYKIGFDSDKLLSLANRIGYLEEGSTPTTTTKVPTIKLISKDKNSVNLSIYVEDEDSSIAYMCNVYRSKNKDSGYESIFNEPFSCVNKNAIYLDTGLEENTKYYYKAMAVGGNNYSNIIEVDLGNNTTKKEEKIVNPKTGNYDIVALMIGFIAGMSALYVFHKNSSIKI